ncbi:MAG: anti-sigma factor [Dehalococcoidia bacterium]|nr:anti-sigma factor [Dehalococcoidia bacterium]
MGAHISQEQADEYAVGSLEPQLEHAIMLHAAECDACSQALVEAERVATSLSLGTPLEPAPEHLRKRVTVAAGLKRPGLIHRALRMAPAAAALAAVFVAVVALAGMVSMRGEVRELQVRNGQLQKQIDDVSSQEVEIFALSQRLSEAEQKARDIEQSAEEDRELLAAMLSPESDVADVITTADGGNSNSIGHLVWEEKQKRLWFVARNLPQLDGTQTYRLWVESGGDYIPLGTLQPDESGTATYERYLPEGIGAYDTAVVSIERSASPGEERYGDSVFFISRLPGSGSAASSQE